MSRGRFSQTAIAVLSIGSVTLSVGLAEPRWAALVGIASQPFWIWETGRSRQWGMFIVSICFTLVYLSRLGRWAYQWWVSP